MLEQLNSSWNARTASCSDIEGPFNDCSQCRCCYLSRTRNRTDKKHGQRKPPNRVEDVADLFFRPISSESFCLFYYSRLLNKCGSPCLAAGQLGLARFRWGSTQHIEETKVAAYKMLIICSTKTPPPRREPSDQVASEYMHSEPIPGSAGWWSLLENHLRSPSLEKLQLFGR